MDSEHRQGRGPVCVEVRSAEGSYPVVYGSGLAGHAREWLDAASGRRGGNRFVHGLGDSTGVFLLISRRVARHWRLCVVRGLGVVQGVVVFDDRETAKTIATMERICRELVRAGADRRAVLVAVGGGVVGDVAGFAAASYLRGVRLAHVPTTLVAQVDSAIGGKTGVNLPEGKNLVGAFYPPRLVLADPETLSTLPAREFRSGLYEVVKYGVIGDARLFGYLEGQMEKLLRRERAALDFVIPRCIRAKAGIVGRDERESGLREILNFGHTFAHAFETATGYSRYLHGEAVGWGMIAASRLAVSLVRLPPEAAARIEKLVRSIGPLPPLPRASAERLIGIMRSDKKTRGGKLRLVLASRIGEAHTVADIPLPLVRETLSDLRVSGV